jgi:hypothetical protein
MKVGVVTTQYASNYGALLQTYALQSYLNEDMKQDAEVLAYYPKHYKNYWKLMPKINSFKTFLLSCICCITPWRIWKFKKRYEKLLGFVEKKVKCSRPYFSKEEIERDKCKYDALICGSDQIWNVSRHSEIESVWFLALGGEWSKPKKIAYAPSVADPIPKDKNEKVKEYLKDFKAVSVREADDVEQLMPLYDGEVQHVCDPVFLLSVERWRLISKTPKIKKPYILCYFLNPSKEAVSVVKKIKKMTGLKVVQIDINNINKIPTDIDVLDASPEEFVGYIENAEYVVTNSFHCTAFSVLFKKNLLVVKKQSANSRMISLLNSVGLSSRFVSEKDVDQMTIKDLVVDYSTNFDTFEGFISQSKEYLTNALEVNYD